MVLTAPSTCNPSCSRRQGSITPLRHGAVTFGGSITLSMGTGVRRYDGFECVGGGWRRRHENLLAYAFQIRRCQLHQRPLDGVERVDFCMQIGWDRGRHAPILRARCSPQQCPRSSLCLRKRKVQGVANLKVPNCTTGRGAACYACFKSIVTRKCDAGLWPFLSVTISMRQPPQPLRARRMSHPSQFSLLTQKRFAPFFWTQFLGAFNDNLFKTALLVTCRRR
jgi:hypothetical protein